MATAKELLAAAAASGDETIEQILVADLDTRVISIPTTITNLGVETDDDVKRLQFRIPRFYGEFDLLNFDFQINYKNADDVGDIYLVDDVVKVDEMTISFTWLVDNLAFAKAGEVKFGISMVLYNSDGTIRKRLNTAVATLPVLKGISTQAAIVNDTPGIFDSLLYRLYAVEAATGRGQDGYYSVVKVDQTDSGALFTIVNQDGETVAYVRHGDTPVKGEDYWTEEDKAEIVEYAKEAVEAWAPICDTVTLATGSWTDNKQTVTVDGVTSKSVIFVAPTPAEFPYAEYTNCAVRCIAQGSSALTFQCETVPSIDIPVNVVVYYNSAETGSSGIVVVDDGEGNVMIL